MILFHTIHHTYLQSVKDLPYKKIEVPQPEKNWEFSVQVEISRFSSFSSIFFAQINLKRSHLHKLVKTSLNKD